MSFEIDFLDMMEATVTYRPFTARSGYGASTFGTTKSVRAKITYKTTIVRGNAEENATSTAQIKIPPPGYVVGSVTTPTVAISDHFTLPDGIDRRVLDVSLPFDESGTPHHQSISLT